MGALPLSPSDSYPLYQHGRRAEESARQLCRFAEEQGSQRAFRIRLSSAPLWSPNTMSANAQHRPRLRFSGRQGRKA